MSLRPVCLLLSLCSAGSAAALGLGELNVRSSLGQPLHATVTLLEAPTETTADCFSIDASGGIVPLPPAQLSLQRNGGQAVLHIRTLQPINEPVAQFALMSDCETRLQRDYTVLLDPPALFAAATVSPEAHDSTAPVAAPAPRASRPQRRAQRPAGASSLPVAGSRPSAPRARATAGDAAPRLVLSGRRGTGASFALRLDTNLPDLDRVSPDGLTATELSDENTALARKLAHLEDQLLALQQRNAELEARRAPAASARTAPPPRQAAKWPMYLLLMGLAAAGIALLAWLLRRSRARRPVPTIDSAWEPHDTPMTTLADTPVEPGTPPQSEPEPERTLEFSEPPRDEGTELKEDILDQAEVFMAHGHGDLAVHLLQEHLREAPTESPVPWLLLLDLLHREGNTAGYDAACAECRRHFNINLAAHPVAHDIEPGPGLEAYPHLLEQMVKVWNTPDIDAFFNELIYDNRGGTRMGFEPGAYREILLLRAIAQDVLPIAA